MWRELTILIEAVMAVILAVALLVAIRRGYQPHGPPGPRPLAPPRLTPLSEIELESDAIRDEAGKLASRRACRNVRTVIVDLLWSNQDDVGKVPPEDTVNQVVEVVQAIVVLACQEACGGAIVDVIHDTDRDGGGETGGG